MNTKKDLSKKENKQKKPAESTLEENEKTQQPEQHSFAFKAIDSDDFGGFPEDVDMNRLMGCGG